MSRATLDPRVKAMTEAQLQSAVVELAERCGWFVTFAPDAMKRLAYAAMKSGRGGGGRWPRKGFPDLLMIRDDREIVAELKSHVGRLEPEQVEWLERFKQAGREVYLWKPADWLEGRIDEVLK